MAGANQEQLKAIEHSGGVLLKAGAGSGKTFVLKEHMIYLAKNWIEEFKATTPIQNFNDFIKSRFSKIVMMTFTKKAAGEISIRLFSEFEKIKETDLKNEMFWNAVCEQLDCLSVTTIHGFCFKLIKQGFFPEVDIDSDMLNESQFNDIIENIFEGWIQNHLSQNDTEFVDLILKEKELVLNSIKGILSDPTLRIMWDKIDLNSLEVSDSFESLDNLTEVLGLKLLFKNKSIISSYSEYDGKKWYDFLKAFIEPNTSLSSMDDYIRVNEYLKNVKYKIPVSPRSNSTEEEIYEIYQGLKNLNAFLKKNGEDIEQFVLNFDSFVIPWFQKIKEIVDYTSLQYKKESGITFSDLEYVVRKGLDDDEIAQKISESYEYLIVDEFQDTSYVQFEIIQKIIKGDFSRLFCVGDIKQAIYGFRGGELGVFLDCQKMTKQVLSLKNNYRSDKNIVEFNNNFFDFLFLKGLKFEGEENNPVEVEYQENPIEDRDLGEIFQITTNLDFLNNFGIEKVGNSEIEYVEALSLYSKILELKKEKEQTCILYKKLKPSLLLIGLFIENNIGFTAQIKVPLGEDPVCSLFKSLIESEFNINEKRDEYLNLIIKAYFAILDGDLQVDTMSLIQSFESDRMYIGLYQAFYNFLLNAGLANSNYKNNLLQIKTMCEIANEDSEYLVSLLSNSESNAYSLDFQFGENASDVTIMTAHASKGLQYPNVLLGGIYTNDKSFPFTGLLGKLPMSMKWSRDITLKSKFKTPEYMLEAELTKRKDFSESKRLFYVACTRAVNRLGWVNIDFGKIKKRTNSNSWQKGIQTWLESEFKTNDQVKKKISEYNYSIESLFNLNFLEQAANRKPLFHIDTLGTTTRLEKTNSKILPELSVTRLASVVDCPRKFYLQNICKITVDDIKLLGGDFSVSLQENEDELSAKSFSSSAERGTELHFNLERVIKNNLEYPSDLEEKSIKEVSWAVENLEKYKDNFKFLSEESIKFELFDYMISGIPDLILLPNDESDEAEIWDFKTGMIKETTQEIYNFQLIAYAYALYKLEKLSANQKIKITLCYLDEKKHVDQVLTKQDVEKYLRVYWSRTSTPDEVNLDHCSSCPYGNICHK